MKARSKIWLAGVAAGLATQVAAALFLPAHSFVLTVFSDVFQGLLLASGTLAFVSRIFDSRGRVRLFWAFMATGIGFWFCYTTFWSYYEVLLRRDVPDLFTGDIVLFLHIVPLMAALGLRPHVPKDEYAARTRGLDFAVLVVWWVYIYVFIVMAWQYAVPDETVYSQNLNAVYLAEKIVFLLAIASCWTTSKGAWRTFYGNLFGSSVFYAASSYVANWAIVHDKYFTGSLYDIPLAIAMAWITPLGLLARAPEPKQGGRESSSAYGVWVARCGMIAAFSLPVFGAWALLDVALPSPVRTYRLELTLAAAIVLGVMVFVRQSLLDRELVRLLAHSQDSFENLKRLQSQIVQSEKMASIGQLVGGAAHELNNPITAMMGYSDLLLATPLTMRQQTLAAKVGQQVRRTRSLVASLLSFARQRPATKTPIDLNMLARTAVTLTEPQAQMLKIDVRVDLAANLPKVLGDSTQLLQVCVQVVSNALDTMDERGSRHLLITTTAGRDFAVLKVWEAAPAQGASMESSSPARWDALGLSACRGIVQEHQGQLVCEEQEDGGTIILVELPVASALMSGASGQSPLLAQSQPFA